MTLSKETKIVNYTDAIEFDKKLSEYCESQQMFKSDFIRDAVHKRFEARKRRLSFNVMLVSSFRSGSKHYNGMNSAAAKLLKIHYPYPERTIIVSKNLKKPERNAMIKHEIIEYLLLKNTKLKYTEAHKKAEELQSVFKENLSFSWRLIK